MHGWYLNDTKKIEGSQNIRAWHGSRLTVLGLHEHPSAPKLRPKSWVGRPGDPLGSFNLQDSFFPAYGMPLTALQTESALV